MIKSRKREINKVTKINPKKQNKLTKTIKPKTVISVVALIMSCVAVVWLAIRIVYWDQFSSLFILKPEQEQSGSFEPWELPVYVRWGIGLALYAWVVFIAYTTLQEHEV